LDAPRGALMLQAVHEFLGRFVSYPSAHAQTAHALWCVHAHLMHLWDSTPRIAFLSPEPASGKSRALEVTELLVPNAVMAVNVSPAYLFRKVGDVNGPPTILFDEIDTVFGPKARENEEIRGLLNAGHRKGAVAGRCVVHGKTVCTEEIPAYAPVALAGLGWLPDTIMTRAVIVPMRRRHAGERIEPFRRRMHVAQGNELRSLIETWARQQPNEIEWPELPPGVEDRDADVWEPLVVVADLVGGDWPALARAAAVSLVSAGRDREASLGVRLLMDLQTVFGNSTGLPTKAILNGLIAIEESPWGNLRGKPLDERGLAHRLRQYSIRSHQVRFGDVTLKGYTREDFNDAWRRYAPPPADKSETSETDETTQQNQPQSVSDVSEPHFGGSDSDPKNTSKATIVSDVSGVSHVREGQEQKCAQCNARDGTEALHPIGDRTVWLHPECKRFWLIAEGLEMHP
jgi:hypothetical protein